MKFIALIFAILIAFPSCLVEHEKHSYKITEIYNGLTLTGKLIEQFDKNGRLLEYLQINPVYEDTVVRKTMLYEDSVLKRMEVLDKTSGESSFFAVDYLYSNGKLYCEKKYRENEIAEIKYFYYHHDELENIISNNYTNSSIAVSHYEKGSRLAWTSIHTYEDQAFSVLIKTDSFTYITEKLSQDSLKDLEVYYNLKMGLSDTLYFWLEVRDSSGRLIKKNNLLANNLANLPDSLVYYYNNDLLKYEVAYGRGKYEWNKNFVDTISYEYFEDRTLKRIYDTKNDITRIFSYYSN